MTNEDSWVTWANYVLNELKRLDSEIRKLEDGANGCRRDLQRRMDELITAANERFREAEARWFAKQAEAEKSLVELKTKITLFASLLGFLAGLIPMLLKLLLHL